jgi:hypothetical protein
MNDDQKWLEAAAGIEQDILYLKAALGAGEMLHGLEKEIKCLKVALAVYKKNAAAGIPWPSPDDLFCISSASCVPLQVSTGMRRDFKIAS